MNASEALELAIAAGEEALKAHREHASPVDWASAAYNQAKIYQKRIVGDPADNLEEAIHYFQAVLGIFAAGAFGPEAAQAWREPNNPHWSESLIKLTAITRSSLQQGQETYGISEFREDWARALLSLGSAFASRLKGDPAANIESAIRAYRQSLEVYSLESYPKSWAIVQNNLGWVYFDRVLGHKVNNLTTAIQHYAAALAVYRQEGFRIEAAGTEHNLGTTLLELAETAFRRPTEVRSREIEEAISLFESALTVRTVEEYPQRWAMTRMMLALAHTYRIKGSKQSNLETAIGLLEETLAQVDLRQEYPLGWVKVLTNLGQLYLQRQGASREASLALAIEHLAAAVRALDGWGMFRESLAARGWLSDALLAMGRTMEAHALLAESLERMLDTRALSDWGATRQLWMLKANALFARMVELCWDHDRDEALVWSERGRGRALAEALGTRDNLPAGVSEDEYQGYLELRAQSDRLERRLAGPTSEAPLAAPLLDELRVMRERVQDKVRHFTALDPSWAAQARPLSREEIVDTARRSRSCLLVLRVLESACYAWLVTPGGEILSRNVEGLNSGWLHHFLLGDLEQGEKRGWLSSYVLMRETRSRLRSRVAAEERADALREWRVGFDEWCGEMDRNLQEIWDAGLGELHQLLTEAGVPPTGDGVPPALILVTSQILGSLPLHAAWRSVNGRRRSWCEDYILSYAPTVSALRQSLLRPQGCRGAGFLGVADPTGDRRSSSLPWAIAEVAQVASRYSVSRRTLFGGPDNEQGWPPAHIDDVVESLRRPQEVIHLACHGVHDPLDPWSGTGLFLTNAAGAPNLTLEGLSSLRLFGCQLAVLSACETALTNPGDVTDEYLGLSAALLSAGAATVFGSLWQINDVATALIIIRACERLISDDSAGYAYSLWEAQNWLRTTDREELEQLIMALPCNARAKEDALEILSRLGDPPFAHPFWWAALACIGRP
ncbi:MAG TPA: CHAT domain-containing protein [Thermoanaerobaculia bacterium]